MPVCTGSELRMDCICRSDAAGPYQWRQTALAEEAKAERTGMIYGSRIQRESHCSNRAVAFFDTVSRQGGKTEADQRRHCTAGKSKNAEPAAALDSTDAYKREI